MLELEDITTKELEKIIDKHMKLCLDRGVKSYVFDTRVFVDESDGKISKIKVAADSEDFDSTLCATNEESIDIVKSCFIEALSDFDVSIESEVEYDNDSVYFTIRAKNDTVNTGNTPDAQTSGTETDETVISKDITNTNAPFLNKWIEIASEELDNSKEDKHKSKFFMHAHLNEICHELCDMLGPDVDKIVEVGDFQKAYVKARSHMNRRKVNKYIAL